MPELRSGRSSISASEKGGRPLQASGLLREMERQNVAPDVINYNAAISACEKGARPEQALELLHGAAQDSLAAAVESRESASLKEAIDEGSAAEEQRRIHWQLLLTAARSIR